MPIQILMPALSPTMEEGTLAKWLVKEGDSVSAGDVIAEIETDKATMEVEAVDEGKIGKILIDGGATGVKVNTPIAVLLEEGEDEAAIGADIPSLQEGEGATPTPDAEEDGRPSPQGGGLGTEHAVSPTSPSMGEVGARRALGGAESQRQVKPNGQSGRVHASPLAKRIAKEKGIDLSALTGSGPYGRIVKRDVEAKPGAKPEATMRGQPVPQVAPAMSNEDIAKLFEPGSFESIPHDGMRRIVAQRLTLAKQTIPHFYLTIDCPLDALLAARARMNESASTEGEGAFKLSVNDFIIKAMAMALQRMPAANATWTETAILRHKSSDVAVAVAVENGLFTPVIRNAEKKSLSAISNEMKDMAARARSKRLAPHEYQGGTTAISNLGMYGIRNFDAVINPPHASILAVGAGEKRAVVVEDEVKIATMMTVTLSVDHRVIDGALGAELLAAFRGFIEDPVTMLA